MADADVIKSLKEKVTFFSVLVFEPFVVVITETKSCYSCFLKRCCCSYCKEVMYLLYSVDDMRRGYYIAESPAGDGICL